MSHRNEAKKTENRSQGNKNDTLQINNLLCTLTSAHALVVPQHIASRTHALVRAKCVDTAEGTEQWILGALVDVFRQRSRFHSIYISMYCSVQFSRFVCVRD